MALIVKNVMERWLKAAKGPSALGRPRPGWVPKDAEYVNPDGTDLEFWLFEIPGARGTRYYAVGYMGKQSKPFMNFYYPKLVQREQAISQALKHRKDFFQRKTDESVAKKEFQTGLLYGDFLYTSWGYDQTQVEFYEIIDVVGDKMVKVREVAHKTVREDSHGTYEMIVPISGKFVGPEMRVKVTTNDTAKIEGHYAHKWDGRPVGQTGPYGGR
jgi:hypothetical protein